MTHSKLGLLGAIAILLGMTAMSTSAAQAAFSWLILDTKGAVSYLKAKVALDEDTLVGSLLTELVGLKVSITCSKYSVENLYLESEGKLSNSKAVFMNCEAYKAGTGENLKCIVRSPGANWGTIETNELKGELVLHESIAVGKEVLVKIAPVGTDLATLRLEGCALTEVNPVRGVLYLKDANKAATFHTALHLIAEGPLTALYLGAHSATKLERTKIDGSAWAGLDGTHFTLAWSAMDS